MNLRFAIFLSFSKKSAKFFSAGKTKILFLKSREIPEAKYDLIKDTQKMLLCQ